MPRGALHCVAGHKSIAIAPSHSHNEFLYRFRGTLSSKIASYCVFDWRFLRINHRRVSSMRAEKKRKACKGSRINWIAAEEREKDRERRASESIMKDNAR